MKTLSVLLIFLHFKPIGMVLIPASAFIPWCVHSLEFFFISSACLNLTHSSRSNSHIFSTTFIRISSFKIYICSNSLYSNCIQTPKWTWSAFWAYFKMQQKFGGIFCDFLSPTSLFTPVQLCYVKNKWAT